MSRAIVASSYKKELPDSYGSALHIAVNFSQNFVPLQLHVFMFVGLLFITFLPVLRIAQHTAHVPNVSLTTIRAQTNALAKLYKTWELPRSRHHLFWLWKGQYIFAVPSIYVRKVQMSCFIEPPPFSHLLILFLLNSTLLRFYRWRQRHFKRHLHDVLSNRHLLDFHSLQPWSKGSSQ